MTGQPDQRPISDVDARTSRRYAVAQSALLVLFAAADLFAPGPPTFVSAGAALVGSALCVAGLLLMAGAFVVLRKVIQIQPAPREGGELVTRGVYGWLRHPIYTGMVLLILGLFLRRPTAWVGATGAVVVVFMIVKSRFEERLLAARYPAYAEYRRRTWGVIPPIR